MPKKLDIILSEALIEKGLITQQDLEPVLKETEASGRGLQQTLVSRGIFFEKDILNILADKLKLKFLDLKEISIDKSVIDKVPVKIASYYKFIPVEIENTTLIIAVSSPLDIKRQDEIRTQLGYNIEIALACENDILEGLKKYYGLAAETLEKITSKTEAFAPEAVRGEVEDIEKLATDASVIKLVNQIILEGWRRRATDIHIEPYRRGVALRYRIDGILYDTNVPPEIKNFLNAIISRIKIMCNLNIVERRLPQDGKTSVKVQERILDLRISIIPTPYGESVVIRLLPTQMLYSLEKLGLSEKDLQIFEDLIQKPNGIIFVSGPTGSGKTTTLYACLSRINTKDRKIITIEDPIEYEVPGITQIQVMPAIGLNFARGLRSMLRHDPDIMMVGEVRDLETAEIAIRVALTGHLVFSTLHTNDAASGIARLLDIGLEPYLVASSVKAFIAQRLVRVICPHCKYEDKSPMPELRKQIGEELQLKSTDEVRIFRGKGCEKCNFSGFFGRTAIYEILLVDEIIEDLINKRTPSSAIKKVAIKKGMRTLRQDGWKKMIAGLTTPEEVMRVTSAESLPIISTAPEEVAEITQPQEGYSGISKKAGQVRIKDILTSSKEEEKEGEEKTKISPEPTHGPEDELILSDRRVYVRINYNINFRYKAYKSKEELSKRKDVPEYIAVTRNISAGGLLFESNELLPIGSFLELRLELPDGEKPMECLARVVRVAERVLDKKYEIGVCFLDISGAERVRLKRICKDRI